MTVSADTQITDLAVNDHDCLTFGEPEELFDLTAAYVRDGLASGLKVVWISDSAAGQSLAQLAKRGIEVSAAVHAGQMATATCADYLLQGEAFSAGHASSWLHGQLASCRDGGYPGLRLAVDMSWALRPISGVEQLPDFEGAVAALLASGTASMLCQYDRERFDPVTLASVAALHTRSVAAATYYHGTARPPDSVPGPVAAAAGAAPAGRACPPGDSPLLDQAFDASSMYQLRAAVAAHAGDAGLSRARAEDLVVAVHELAANVVRHGHGRLLVWRQAGELHCQITEEGGSQPAAAVGPAAAGQDDTGQGDAAPAGPPWRIRPGHGLWLVRELADRTHVRPAPHGVTSTITFRLEPDS
ncbi:MAG: MEDS domain-containing protein [Streptosporangiaceae bacterium]